MKSAAAAIVAAAVAVAASAAIAVAAAVDAVTLVAAAAVVTTARLAGSPAKATGDSLTLKRPRQTEHLAGGASICQ